MIRQLLLSLILTLSFCSFANAGLVFDDFSSVFGGTANGTDGAGTAITWQRDVQGGTAVNEAGVNYFRFQPSIFTLPLPRIAYYHTTSTLEELNDITPNDGLPGTANLDILSLPTTTTQFADGDSLTVHVEKLDENGNTIGGDIGSFNLTHSNGELLRNIYLPDNSLAGDVHGIAFRFSSTNMTPYSFEFGRINGSTQSSFVANPEPASFMMLTSVLGLVGLRRRKR